ncbi:MAG TPA: M81 family metallopeptidase [Roseiflexaceae bacterium]|mgnify:CR=1 FL=1|nr:M81 family metallopeptidase [Roseiflexaceae bacterium]
MRIAIGGIVQESNSFSPVPGSWLHFPSPQILRADELLTQRIATRTEIGGAIDVAREHGISLLPLFHASASASAGALRRDLYVALRDELIGRLRAAGPVDGVLLVMHGAMAAEGCDDATGEVIRQVREMIGPDTPIVVTLDLHANVTYRMVEHASAIVGYHTAPHIDLYETGRGGTELLIRTIAGEVRPTMALRRLPMILPAENGRTTDGPYAEVMQRAISLCSSPGALEMSVFSVQPWLDLEDVGCSVVTVTDSEQALAEELADELAEMFWERRTRFTVTLRPAAETLREALAAANGPVVVADSADAPSSGAPGDATGALALLLAEAPTRPCMLNIVDPEAVAHMIAVGVGSDVTLRLGASSGCLLYEPIEVSGRVRLISDGEFVNKGQGFQGVTFYRGRTGVLQIGQIALVVMERPVIQWDPELYRSVGLEPADAQVVIVKSPAAFRAAYAPFAAAIEILDVPGVCSPNLATLPFRRVRRPLYPLDPHMARE